MTVEERTSDWITNTEIDFSEDTRERERERGRERERESEELVRDRYYVRSILSTSDEPSGSQARNLHWP